MLIKIINSTIILLAFVSCNAQTPVVDIESATYGEVSNAYYKDLSNFQNQFVGTWAYTDGNKSLTVTLQKKMMHLTEGGTKYYTDMIVGEYKYSENSDVLINTLLSLSLNRPSPFDYNLYGNSAIPRNLFPACNECGINEKRLKLEFKEPTRLHPWAPQASFVLRRSEQNGNPILIARLDLTTPAVDPPIPELANFSVPYGEYILVKQ